MVSAVRAAVRAATAIFNSTSQRFRCFILHLLPLRVAHSGLRAAGECPWYVDRRFSQPSISWPKSIVTNGVKWTVGLSFLLDGCRLLSIDGLLCGFIEYTHIRIYTGHQTWTVMAVCRRCYCCLLFWVLTIMTWKCKIIDKRRAENRTKSTKHLPRSKFANYEALFAINWYVTNYGFLLFCLPQNIVLFAHKHRRYTLKNHSFRTTKIPFLHHEDVTLRS